MSDWDAEQTRYVILCVSRDAATLHKLARDLQGICGRALDVKTFDRATNVSEHAQQLVQAGDRVPLVIIDAELPEGEGTRLLIGMHDDARFLATRYLLMAGSAPPVDAGHPLQGERCRRLTRPWDYSELRERVQDFLTDFLIELAPSDIQRFADTIDIQQLSEALVSSERDRQALGTQVKMLQRSFLADMQMSDEDVEQAMIAGIADALDDPQRKTVPAGSIILEAGQNVEGISIIVSGRVQMFKPTGDREVIMHTHSAGKIIGLLSLAHRRKAFYTCRALTDVTLIPVSLDQLDRAMQTNPKLSIHFVTVLIRSLATRIRRVAELQVEVENLNRDLSAQRDQLADALHQLKQAHLRLVQSEKLASLGQLSAGVAHELNNPIGAIQRTVDFLLEDITLLMDHLPGGLVKQDLLRRAFESPPLSTREERGIRRRLTEELGDDALARQLLQMGITDAQEYRARTKGIEPEERNTLLEELGRVHQIGRSLRNLRSCSERVTALVNSLRSYSRADEARVDHVNLHEGIEDTLLLFGHSLRNVNIEREFGDLPPIECHVGELNQVWTNLISNALQAMKGEGTLRIETASHDPDHVRVRIIDSGPGIPEKDLPHIFDLNFTTRTGSAHFGLGLGLAITRNVIDHHQGTIDVESGPGHTCFTIILPVHLSEARRKEQHI